MLKIIDILNTSLTDFKDLVRLPKYSALIQRKMKIIIETALSGNIEAKKIYLIERTDESDISQQVADFVASLDMEWCEINRGGVFSQFAHSQAEEILSDIKSGEVVMLRDFVLTDYCGYAWVNCQKDIFIEAKKGGFYSYWEGTGIPTQYLVSEDGSIKLADERASSVYYSYDFDAKKWSRRDAEEPETVRLTQSDIEAIRRILFNVNKVYHNVKVAWIKSRGSIVVFDIWIMFGQGVLE